tara:strand:- start:726 stop:977 length:252 start_codon:yes stop_codon:yes gene_type:complete
LNQDDQKIVQENGLKGLYRPFVMTCCFWISCGTKTVPSLKSTRVSDPCWRDMQNTVSDPQIDEILCVQGELQYSQIELPGWAG